MPPETCLLDTHVHGYLDSGIFSTHADPVGQSMWPTPAGIIDGPLSAGTSWYFVGPTPAVQSCAFAHVRDRCACWFELSLDRHLGALLSGKEDGSTCS